MTRSKRTAAFCHDPLSPDSLHQSPITCLHMSEMMMKPGLEIDPSCIWRWVQQYGPELEERCRPHLKPTNKSHRVDETYITVKGKDRYLYRASARPGRRSTSCSVPSVILPRPNI